ncbi:MAG: hypothetical protein K6G00_02315 [Treponema sp.]|nr:hypothetical protein [Treponema sp.]
MAFSVLCADIGTSSLKAAVLTEEGMVQAYSRQQFLYLHTDHAAGEWLSSLTAAIRDIYEKNPSIKLDAICISGNGPTIAVPSGETVRWNDDVPKVNAKSLFIPRIIAFKQKYPSIWNKAENVFSGPECLIFELTGRAVSILPEQRYKKAYWTGEDLQSEGFSKDEILKLPAFVTSGSKAGSITIEVAQSISCPLIKQGLPVYCGAPDFISALVGTDTLCPGKICDRAGSSEGLNVCTPVPVNVQGIRTLPSVMPDLWNASYLLPESGILFSAFKNKMERELGHEIDFNTLVHECLAFKGTDLKSSLAIGKQIMNETARQVKSGLESLSKALEEIKVPMQNQMTITGGQAANTEWMQMKADVTGMKILVPECHDAELTGDAVFTFTGMQVFSSVSEGAAKMCRIKKVIEPRQAYTVRII